MEGPVEPGHLGRVVRPSLKGTLQVNESIDLRSRGMLGREAGRGAFQDFGLCRTSIFPIAGYGLRW